MINEEEKILLNGMAQLSVQANAMIHRLLLSVGDDMAAELNDQQELELVKALNESLTALVDSAGDLVEDRKGTPIIIGV